MTLNCVIVLTSVTGICQRMKSSKRKAIAVTELLVLPLVTTVLQVELQLILLACEGFRLVGRVFGGQLSLWWVLII
jgi:hypothetical protein